MAVGIPATMNSPPHLHPSLFPPVSQHQQSQQLPVYVPRSASVQQQGRRQGQRRGPSGHRQQPLQPVRQPQKRTGARRQNQRGSMASHGPERGSAQRGRGRGSRRRKFVKGSFQQLDTPRSTPRTVPRAPLNTTSYLISAAGDAKDSVLLSPQEVSTPAHLPQEEDAAQLGPLGPLDYFGSCDGLITRTTASPGSGSSDGEGSDEGQSDSEPEQVQGYELHLGNEASIKQPVPRQLQSRLEDQSAYVLELEQENLNLRERLFLLEEELKETRKIAAHTAEDTAHS